MILSPTQVAWAPGVGIKESAFRKLCNIELGVTYIPWEKAPDNLDPLLDGGVLDEDSIPQDFAGRLAFEFVVPITAMFLVQISVDFAK